MHIANSQFHDIRDVQIPLSMLYNVGHTSMCVCMLYILMRVSYIHLRLKVRVCLHQWLLHRSCGVDWRIYDRKCISSCAAIFLNAVQTCAFATVSPGKIDRGQAA